MKQQGLLNKTAFIIFLCLFGFVGSKSSATAAQDAVGAVLTWDEYLSSEDRQLKHCKMSISPFSFYRGSNHLFWGNFANDSRLAQFGSPQSRIWIQGDLHAENFGAYDDAEGTVVYGLNDFDESVIADYQYDLWRMAIGLLLLTRQNHLTEQSAQEQILEDFGESYLETLKDVDANALETQTVFSRKNTSEPLKNFLKTTEKKESRKKMLKKWTQKSKGERHFDLSLEDLEQLPAKITAEIRQAMPDYLVTLGGSRQQASEYFRIKSLARRLHAGTGSLGTPRYYALIEGDSDSQDDDRILDIKQQGRPTPYTFLGESFQQEYAGLFANDAQRHAIAYQALSLHTDAFSGWMQLSDGFYSVRERSPYKASFPTETLSTGKSFRKMAEQWGRILAFAHARADQDSPGSLIEYSFGGEVLRNTKNQHGEFLALLRTIAFEYAAQVESDWRSFKEQLGGNCPK